MSAFKPRKVDSNEFFLSDQREEKKFWYLDPVVQPIVPIAPDGRFIRPGMIEDELQNEAGNVAIAAFPDAFVDGQVWVIDHIGVLNGGAAAKLMGVSVAYGALFMYLGSDAAVGIAAPQELLTNDIYIDEQVGIQIAIGGAAADAYSVHARRVA